MAKRKAGVNDIIYELENDDSELSSEEEVKQPKISRIEENNSPNTTQSDSNTQSSCLETIDVDSSTEKFVDLRSPKALGNGGKSPVEYIIIDEVSETTSSKASLTENEREKKLMSDTIFDEDIIIDSPASNSDLGVVGCENKTPLVTVKFKDNKLAMKYKKQIKAFMLNLIKLHENTLESDNDTDLELDIWPEDLEDYEKPEKPADNLFFIDTDPSLFNRPIEIPCYSQNTPLICNAPEIEQQPPMMAKFKGLICFNCNGSHNMRECREPRNHARIAQNRKAIAKKGRYHVEDEQKYGHLVPGRISGQLRNALGLKRHELPLHIYRMRQLGYPSGWLEEARISHSGITLFDSTGQATLDPEDEEGELAEPGSKDKFDIKKILDFPGFNVPASSRYKEEAHTLGLPPMSDADSKLAMLAVLAPNAMHAYKRKKLALFPSAPGQAPSGTAEMDIDSGDEIADFPSQPPLPDDVPPPAPPPPDSPPPPETPPLPPLPPEEPTQKINSQSEPKMNTESDDDIEVLEVLQVKDIPVPFADMITIDVDGEVSEPEMGCASPSLDELERKKRLLLDALGTEETVESKETTTDADTEDGSQTVEIPSDLEIVDEKVDGSSNKIDKEVINSSKNKTSCKDMTGEKLESTDKMVVEPASNVKQANESISTNKTTAETTLSKESVVLGEKIVEPSSIDKVDESSSNDKTYVEPSSIDEISIEPCINDKTAVETTSNDNPTAGTSVILTPKGAKDAQSTITELNKTPISSMGQVRGTEYGTPVINVASPYAKLPRDDKFAKDICDVINFENLPNSIGKYKKISKLLKKVKSEVDRIQES